MGNANHRRIHRRIPPTSSLVCMAFLASCAGAYAAWLLGQTDSSNVGPVNADTYVYFAGNVAQLQRAWQEGSGFWWNPYQSCGQPFFANAVVGALYPFYLPFYFLDFQRAHLAQIAIHLAIAGSGTFYFCRALRLSRVAALSAALAMQFGGSMLLMVSWWPPALAAYSWLPWALGFCERTLAAGRSRHALLLCVVLALQILVGYLQFSFFAYQCIALRLLWELLTNRHARVYRRSGFVVLALALAPALTALQLLPYIAFISESFRGGTLSAQELRQGGGVALDWAGFRHDLEWRMGWGYIAALLPFVCAGAALGHRRRREVTFYALAALVYFALAFDNVVFDVYRQLPFGSTFRMPQRFLLLSALFLSLLSAFGIDALLLGKGKRRLALGGGVAMAFVFWLVAPRGISATEALLLAALALVALAVTRERPGRALVVLVPALVLFNAEPLRLRPFAPILSSESLFAGRDAFSLVKGRITSQERMYTIRSEQGLAVTEKSASLFGIASARDYEAQTSRRYIELTHWLFHGVLPVNVIQTTWLRTEIPAHRPLLDLLAVRFLVNDQDATLRGGKQSPPLRKEQRFGNISVESNLRSLPRAFFVPEIRVVESARERLRTLAAKIPAHNPKRVALVEALPDDQYTGHRQGRGTVSFVRDDPEELILSVSASRAGFLYLGDQYYPGWRAWVDGSEQSILRANHAFRLVAVPAGDSQVRFAYEPPGLRPGAAISLFSFAILALAAIWPRFSKSPPSDASSGTSRSSTRALAGCAEQ